jgi:hypothetical protein
MVSVFVACAAVGIYAFLVREPFMAEFAQYWRRENSMYVVAGIVLVLCLFALSQSSSSKYDAVLEIFVALFALILGTWGVTRFLVEDETITNFKYSSGPRMRVTIAHEEIPQTGLLSQKASRYAVHVACEFTREEIAIIQEMDLGGMVVYEHTVYHPSGLTSSASMNLASFVVGSPLTFEFPSRNLAAECDRELTTKVFPRIKALLARGSASIDLPATRTLEL